MDERIVQIEGGEFPAALVSRVVEIVRGGGVLIHPTATIHGYGCRYDLPEPVARIRKLKGRDGEKPMIVLVNSIQWLDRICDGVPDEARILAKSFWPGPLTLVLKAAVTFSFTCSWPAETVALRQCAHPFTSSLLLELDVPFVSTSLGYSGADLPEDSLDFTRRLYEIFPPGSAEPPELAVIDRTLDKAERQASAIVDMSTPGEFRLLRRGKISAEELECAGGFQFQEE